jgi:hypothetical protein
MDNNYCVMQKLSPDAEIISVRLNFNLDSPTDIFLSYCAEDDFDLIVGNGFGAFLGYILGAELNVKTVLTNPLIPAHDRTIIELIPYEEELKGFWEKYQNKNTDCHILLSVLDSTIDSDKLFNLLRDTADIKLLCNTPSIFNSSTYEEWLNTYL